MRIEPLSVEEYERTIKVLEEHNGNRTQAAKALGIGRSSLQDRLKKFGKLARQGRFGTDPVIPGFEITEIATTQDRDGATQRTRILQKPARHEPDIPDGMRLKELSVNISPMGEVQRWAKYSQTAPDPASIAAIVRQAFEGYTPTSPAIIAEQGYPSRLNIFILTDMHAGLETFKSETGEQYDHEIGAELYRTKMAQLMAETAPAEKALIINLGDAFHANDHRNLTPASEHMLDVSARLLTVTRNTVAVFRDAVEMALGRHDSVVISHLRGNHDPTAAIALIVAADAQYGHNSRVKLYPAEDELERDVFFLRYGKNLIGAHHGHRLKKPEDMAMCMASECREDWGDTLHHHFLYGHIHHSTVKEVGGCIVESFRTLAPGDAFHVSRYQSGRSLTSITLDEMGGEHGRKHINLPPMTRRAKVV